MFPPAAAPESPPGTVDGASNYGTPASEVPVPTPGSLLMAIASMPVDPTPALVTQRVKQQLHAAKQDVTTYAQAASEFHLELSDPTKPWDSGPLVFLACIQGKYHLCHSLVAAPPVIYRGPYWTGAPTAALLILLTPGASRTWMKLLPMGPIPRLGPPRLLRLSDKKPLRKFTVVALPRLCLGLNYASTF